MSEKPKLDLATLHYIKNTFDVHSDQSTNCNGYNSLCKIIEITENRVAEEKKAYEEFQQFVKEHEETMAQILKKERKQMKWVRAITYTLYGLVTLGNIYLLIKCGWNGDKFSLIIAHGCICLLVHMNTRRYLNR